MSRHREISDRWSALRSSRQSQVSKWQHKSTSDTQIPPVNPTSGVQDAHNVASTSSSQQPPTLNSYQSANQQFTDNKKVVPPLKPLQQLQKSFPSNWKFWGIIIILLSSGLGFLSIALLLKLPAVPNCPRLFLPTASWRKSFRCR